MKKCIIPAGQTPSGEVIVSGAKNSAIKLLSAALLSEEKTKIENFPTQLIDVFYEINFIRQFGIDVVIDHIADAIMITPNTYRKVEFSNMDMNLPIRTTYLLAAFQLLREGEAYIPYPSGDNLGLRGYDLHLVVWKQFGYDVNLEENYIYLKKQNAVRSIEINFPYFSIGATENALLCASINNSITIINNAYISPEVYDLISMLKLMGVRIRILGGSCIEIEGNRNLRGVNYTVMPDRIEAITWLIYGILSGGEIMIKNVPFESLKVPLIYIGYSGVDILKSSDTILINKSCVGRYGIQPFEMACGSMPGIISDMQPFFVLLALKARGRSLIVDYRYPERTSYLQELNKFVDKPIAFNEKGYIRISGPVHFGTAVANSTDLRGSMAAILAALLSEGEGHSVILNPNMALRGYNKLAEKLSNLGILIDFPDT